MSAAPCCPARRRISQSSSPTRPKSGAEWSSSPASGRSESPLHVKQFDVEDQRGVRRDDAAGSAGAVTEFRRDDERALAADLHGGDAFLPTGDDLAPADGKLEWLAAIDRTVELSALGAAFVEPA